MDPVLAYLLIVLGLLCLAAEVFIPSFGVLFVLGIGGLVAGVAMLFSYDSSNNTSYGLITLIGLFVFIPIAAPLLLHYWPKTSLGKRFFLPGPEKDDTLATMPVALELEQLRNRYGKTVSWLRPAGITVFDGRRVDTLSEGTVIEPGVWVRCIDVHEGRVIVRQVEKPPDLGDMPPTELIS
jgi:membrane-bound serine protease (ClpP class)